MGPPVTCGAEGLAGVIRDNEGSVAFSCAAFVAQAPVTGAAFTVAASEVARAIVWASDGVARDLAQLQYSLGDGPAQTAMAEHRPVLIEDLWSPGALDRWPFFARGATDLPMNALFVFPLQLGGTIFGVCDGYSTVAGLPSAEELTGMLRALDRVTDALLGSLVGGGSVDGAPHVNGVRADGIDGYDNPRAVVHQATGMVSVHLGIDVAQAFIRLRAHAYARGQHLHEAATDVVHGGVRLEDDST